MEIYLQTLWGDQWENVTTDIVRLAIAKIKKMDDEHGSFWVGLVKEDENVLEVHKDLRLIGVFEDEPGIQYNGQGESWDEVESIFAAFLSDNMDIVKMSLSAEKSKL